MGLLFKPTDDPAVVELRIGTGDCYELNGQSQEQFRQFRAALAAIPPRVSEINVRINLPGGHANISIGLHDLLRGWRGRVVTSVEQVAWSSGAVLSQAGSVRRMAADGIFGTHHANVTIDLSVVPTGVFIAPAADLRRYADLVDQMDEQCIRIFADRTGRSAADVRALLDKDDCMTAQEAKAWGLIDEITAPVGRKQNWQPHLWPRVKAAYERADSNGEAGLSVTNDATNPTTALDVSWDASSGANSYSLLGASTLAGPFTLIASGISGTSATITELTPGTEYAFQVEAVSSGGTSAASSGVAWATEPSAPTSLSAPSMTATAISLSFLFPTIGSNLSLSCEYRYETPVGAGNWVTGNIGNGTSPIAGLSPLTQYGIEIASVIQSTNGDWEGTIQSPWTMEITVVTPALPPPVNNSMRSSCMTAVY
jgi:ATP-dependent protease ClpP protease subunit